MDDKFMEDLKSFSVQDIIEDQQQRPSTARIGTARGSRIKSGMVKTNNAIVKEDSFESIWKSDAGSSKRPDSAVFNLSFNRPKTSRTTENSFSENRPSTIKRGHSRNANADSVRAYSGVHRGKSDEENKNSSGDYIPDLDEVMEEDFSGMVATAPAFEMQRIATLKELDAELLQSKPFSVVDGVDLRRLCGFMIPEKDLEEPDELWTWDTLYAEISSSQEYNEMMDSHRKIHVDVP